MKKTKILKGISAFALTTMASVGLVNAAGTCTGTTKTNFYIFIDANTYGHLSSVTTPWSHNTLKQFSEGLDSDTIINKGQISVSKGGTETLSTSTSSWTGGNAYKAYVDAKSSNNKKVSGNNTYYISTQWFDQNGDEQTGTAETPTLSEFNSNTILPETSFESFIIGDEQIAASVKRTYSASLIGGISTSTASGTYFYAPAVYYVSYCEGGDTEEPTTDEPTTDNPTDESTNNNNNTNTNTDTNTGTKTSEGYTITYDANGGSNAPAKYVSSDSSSTKISTETPTLAGNKFLGWSTDQNAKEADANYAPGSTYSAGKDITLYAVWQTKTGIADYTIAALIVGAAATAGLVVAKRKNAIRQI